MGILAGQPMKRRLSRLTLLTSTLPLLVAGVGAIVYERVTERAEAAAALAATADLLAQQSGAALAREDAAALARRLEGLAGHPDILAGAVFDRAGRVAAAYSVAGDDESAIASDAAAVRPGPDWLDVRRPVTFEDAEVGAIVLRADLRALNAKLRRHALLSGVAILLVLAAAQGAGVWLRRSISRPLVELAAIARRVAGAADFSVRARRSGDRELDTVIDGFNAMLEQLQARDAALQKARDELERRVEERARELRREQARFKAIFDAAPVGFTWMLQGDVGTRIVNPAHEQITGVPADQRHELNRYRDATHPEDRAAQDALHSRLLAGEIEHYEVEKRYVHRDGSVRWTALTVRFYRDPATGELQEINTVVDITERKRAEAGFAEASKLLDAMLENTPDMIYFKDRESRFVRFSKAFVDRFKLTAEKTLIGKTDFDLFTPEHAQEAFDDEQEIIRTGRAIVGRVERETYADGSVTWAMTTKMPWRDGAGAIIGTFGISKDVTALKQAEAKAAYERDLLQLLLDNLPDTIYFKDVHSRFVRFSRSKADEALRILRLRHWTSGETGGDLPAHVVDRDEIARWLIGKTDFDVFPEERARIAFEEEQEIIRSGVPVVNRMEEVVQADGSVTWHLITKMPWRDKEGKVVGTFGTTHNITAIKQAEAKLEETHKQLLVTSRQAGMAEVATGVLHNVGNVLNSVNVSATLVADHVRRSKATKVAKLAELFARHRGNLGEFITQDTRGQMVPEYLSTLAEAIAGEQQSINAELENLRKNIEHIKDIVAMQQAYAKTSGMVETVSVPDMVEDAIRINAGSLARHDVTTVRDYQARGVVTTDKHKVIQILINLVRNAKYACDESGRTDKQIVVRTTSYDRGIRIAVIDNGVGIAPENLTRVFAHGFTTRQHGHGFGLHSGALAAKELGGSLTAHSDGAGCGATFILEIPYKLEAKSNESSG